MLKGRVRVLSATGTKTTTDVFRRRGDDRCEALVSHLSFLFDIFDVDRLTFGLDVRGQYRRICDWSEIGGLPFLGEFDKVIAAQ